MSYQRVGRSVRVFAFAVLVAGTAAAQSSEPAKPTEAAKPTEPETFSPPTCTGTVFLDVTCVGPFDAWIEQYARDEITGGCGGGDYCPDASVTRGQMAVFVEKAMRGTAVWGPGDVGGDNTALGFNALASNNNAVTEGNTALGFNALITQSFDNGGTAWNAGNTAVGSQALFSNQPTAVNNGFSNSAIGYSALFANTTGSSNSAVGADTLQNNQIGSNNVAFGFQGLFANTSDNNTAVGSQSLTQNTSGSNNTAVGWEAGNRTEQITGYAGSLVTFTPNMQGSDNTFVGISGALGQLDNCTAVGMDAYCDDSNQVRLGNVSVTSIGGKVAWSALSDARAKTDVHELDRGLDLVLALRPVAYRYKSGNGRIDMGFVAQEVEALLGDRYNVVDVGGDADRTLSLRYTDLIAPLVKATQEQQATIEAQRARIDALEAQVAALARKLAD